MGAELKAGYFREAVKNISEAKGLIAQQSFEF
jgi:hypothetical protein